MSRYSAFHVPTYRLHKQSGQAIVTIAGKDFLLGPFDSPPSRDRYNQLIAQWYAAGREPAAFHGVTSTRAKDPGAIVDDVIAAFWSHAQTYYRDRAGNPTSELKNDRYDLRILRKLYGSSPAKQFGPLALKAVQAAMIGEKLRRKSINRRINRMRHVFKWAVGQELVPSSVFEVLSAVSGLKANRSGALETPQVTPATDDQIKAAIAHANRHVAAMIELQAITGMRSGEMLIMRGGDIDWTGEVWCYVPSKHKTEHHGHQRRVFLGQRAQQILTPFLKSDPAAYLFSPADAEFERRAALTALRKTPVCAGNRPGTNRSHRPLKRPGLLYTVTGYAHAVAKACEKALARIAAAAIFAKRSRQRRQSAPRYMGPSPLVRG